MALSNSARRRLRRNVLKARHEGKDAAIALMSPLDNPYLPSDLGRRIAWAEGFQRGLSLIEEPPKLEL